MRDREATYRRYYIHLERQLMQVAVTGATRRSTAASPLRRATVTTPGAGRPSKPPAHPLRATALG